MRHVDALSRNPTPNVLLLDTHDWILALQMQDESIRLIMDKLAKTNDQELLNTYVVNDDRLYRKTLDGKIKLVVPKSARFNLMRKYHDDIGHVGLRRCESLIKEKILFKNMTRFIKKICHCLFRLSL